MKSIKTEYNGVEIVHICDSDYIEFWKVINCEYGEYQNPVLQKVRDWIDRQIKKQFKRYDVIFSSYNGLSLGTVTSENGDDIFVTQEDGGRKKVEKRNVVKKTDENILLFNRYKEIEEAGRVYYKKMKKEEVEIIKRIFERDN